MASSSGGIGSASAVGSSSSDVGSPAVAHAKAYILKFWVPRRGPSKPGYAGDPGRMVLSSPDRPKQIAKSDWARIKQLRRRKAGTDMTVRELGNALSARKRKATSEQNAFLQAFIELTAEEKLMPPGEWVGPGDAKPADFPPVTVNNLDIPSKKAEKALDKHTFGVRVLSFYEFIGTLPDELPYGTPKKVAKLFEGDDGNPPTDGRILYGARKLFTDTSISLEVRYAALAVYQAIQVLAGVQDAEMAKQGWLDPDEQLIALGKSSRAQELRRARESSRDPAGWGDDDIYG